MKEAHIVTELHEVGDKVIGICGEEHRVKVKWNDVPEDKPICRTCVDVAVRALHESEGVVERTRVRSEILVIHLDRLIEELNPDLLLLDSIAEADQEFRKRRDEKADRKRDKRLAKRTCICLWVKGEPVVEPTCPIHGTTQVRGTEDVELPEHDVPTPGSVQRNGDE